LVTIRLIVVFLVPGTSSSGDAAEASQSAFRLAGRCRKSSDVIVRLPQDFGRLQLTSRPSRSVTAPKAFTTRKAAILIVPS
jgi:hypothetical protein